MSVVRAAQPALHSSIILCERTEKRDGRIGDEKTRKIFTAEEGV